MIGAKKNNKTGLCSPIGFEHIRAKLRPGDLFPGDVLDGRPVLGVDLGFSPEPIADELLAGRTIQETPDPTGEGGLAPGNADSLLQGGNVRFIHEHRGYTNAFVFVNNPVCVTDNKDACIVPFMPALKRKQQLKEKAPPRKAKPGQDGKTLGQRLSEAMAYESGRRGSEYRPVDLLDDVNNLAGTPKDQPALSQQMLSAILRGTVSRSSLTPLMAAACHVNPLWLGSGIGKRDLPHQ